MEYLPDLPNESEEDSIVVIHSVRDVKLAIQDTFCDVVDPELFLRVLKKHRKVFSPLEEIKILQQTLKFGQNGGALAILDKIILLEDGVNLLIDVLTDEEVGLLQLANTIKTVLDGLNSSQINTVRNPAVSAMERNVFLGNKTGTSNEKCEISESSDKQMSTRQPQANRIALLLIGKTGSGKSRTGNTILGQDLFKADASFESVTRVVETGVVNFNGREIFVVDQPGVGDTANIGDPEKAAQFVLDSNKHAFTLNPEGYHAFLIIVKFGSRYTEEDVECIRLLKHVFGQDFLKNYGVLIVTYGDNFKKEVCETFNKWCNNQKGHFKTLLDECSNRALLFDNITPDETVRRDQVEDLINVIERLILYKHRYSFDTFEEFQQSREYWAIKAKEAIIRDKALNELKLINDTFTTLSQNKTLDDNDKIENHKKLIQKVDALRANVIEEDKQNNILMDLIAFIDAIRAHIQRSETSIVELKQLKEKIEKETIERENEKKTLEQILQNIAEFKHTLQQNYEFRKRYLEAEYEMKINLENVDQNKASLKRELKRKLQELKRKYNDDERDLCEKETMAKQDKQTHSQISKDFEKKRMEVLQSSEKLRDIEKQETIETLKHLKGLKEENRKLLERIDKAEKEKIESLEAKLKTLKKQMEVNPNSIDKNEKKALQQQLDQLNREYSKVIKARYCTIM